MATIIKPTLATAYAMYDIASPILPSTTNATPAIRYRSVDRTRIHVPKLSSGIKTMPLVCRQCLSSAGVEAWIVA